MRIVTTIIAILFTSLIYGQGDRILSYQKEIRQEFDTVLQIMRPVSYFVLRDTAGDVQTGNYRVTVSTLDSTEFIAMLYQLTKEQLNGVGQAEAAKMTSLRNGNNIKSKAAQIVGSDNYRQTIAPGVRSAMSGQYNYRRGAEVVNVTGNNQGRFFDGQTLRLVINPWSDTWVIAVDAAHGNELINLYKVQEGVWIGESAGGIVVLRKTN